ncbi:MAG: putative signal peptide protein [Deltaproteobacteria bacterium]|nr:putative signal peptide protein [Deltaproteobacteria bacterium]
MRQLDRALLWLVAPPAIVLTALPAHATQYLSTEQAQRALFADANRFEPVSIAVREDQRNELKKISGTRTPLPLDRIWRAMRDDQLLGHLIVDEVYGKHEFITYAAAIDANGAVIGIEILDYRETHGGEVREASWRKQFRGKRSSDALELDADIVNISGATMSCKHVTEGVRRLLALYDIALKGR